MKRDDIDVVIKVSAELRPIRPLATVTEQVSIQQEEVRLNYYLGRLAEIIENKIKNGEPIVDDTLDRLANHPLQRTQ